MDTRFHIGRMLVLFGILFIVSGVAVMFIDKLPFLGRLPGDFRYQGKNWSVHIPIVTSLLLSLILTIVLNLFLRR